MMSLNNKLRLIPLMVVAFFILGSLTENAFPEILTGMWKGELVEYETGKIPIRLKPGVSTQDIQDLLAQLGAVLYRDVNKLRSGVVGIPDTVDVFQVIDSLQASPLIESAGPSVCYYPYDTDPSDPYYLGTSPATYPHQWALKNTGQNPPGGTSDADIDAPAA